MSQALKDKYIRIILKGRANPVPGTKCTTAVGNQSPETLVNTGVSAVLEGAEISLPITETITRPITENRIFASMPVNYIPAKLWKPKPGGKADWYVFFKYPDPLTGELTRFIKKAGINKIKNLRAREAEGEGLAEAINELLANDWTPFAVQSKEEDELKSKTIGECLDFVCEVRCAGLRGRSKQHYKDTIRLFKEFLEHRRISFYTPRMLTKADAFAFGDYMSMVKKYAGKTYNGHKSNINGFLDELVEREIMPKNVFKKVLAKKAENTAKNLAFTHEERATMKKYFKEHNPLLGYFCQFQFYLAVRPSELMQAQIRDIVIDRSPRIMIWTGNAKNRRQEPVQISEHVIAMLKEMDYTKGKPTDYLFGYKLEICDTPWIRNRVTEMHSSVIKKLKMNPNHNLYSWKHTGAVEYYYACGKDILKVKTHLRHYDIRDTIKYLRTLININDYEVIMPAF